MTCPAGGLSNGGNFVPGHPAHAAALAHESAVRTRLQEAQARQVGRPVRRDVHRLVTTARAGQAKFGRRFSMNALMPSR